MSNYWSGASKRDPRVVYLYSRHYSSKKGNKAIDYPTLAKWSQEREGQIIVCENTRADWLPFYPTSEMSGQLHKTTESIWSNLPHNFAARQGSLF